MEFGLDLGEREAGGAHAEGAADAGEEGRVGDPAMADAWRAVTAGADVDRLTDEAQGRHARHAAVRRDQVPQAAFYVRRRLPAFFFVADVDEELDDASVLAFRDRVGERMDDDIAVAQQRLVIDGIVEVACEAGVIPEQEAEWAVFRAAGGVDHAVEFVAPDGGAARPGDVDEAPAKLEAVRGAEGFDFGQLLVGGSFLPRTAAIADIRVDERAGGEVGRGRNISQCYSLVRLLVNLLGQASL